MLDQDFVCNLKAVDTFVKLEIKNKCPFKVSLSDLIETENHQSMPNDGSNLHLTNTNKKIFHKDAEVLIANTSVQMYKSLEKIEMALHEFSREQKLEIACGGGRRKKKFGAIHWIRLIYAIRAK